MALKVIGTADCPLCSQPAPVGISRNGEGQAIHLLCAPCGVNLQARRSSPAAQRFIQQAQGTRAQGKQEKDDWGHWEPVEKEDSDRRETPWTERPSAPDARPFGAPID